jgi:hypothetical protein
VVADALRGVDPVGARGAEASTDWRREYLVHFRRLVEAGLPSREAALRVADDGLTSLHKRMRYRTEPGGDEQPLDAAFGPSGPAIATKTVDGAGEPQGELVVPYRGRHLGGEELGRQLERWSPPARSSRPAPMRSGPSPRTPAGSRCPGGAPSSSAPARRWGRCARCCAGAPT